MGPGSGYDSVEEFGFSIHRGWIKSLKEESNGERRGKERNKKDGEKEKRSILLLHLCAKIADKCNLRKNKFFFFFLFIVLGHLRHDWGHMVVGAMGLQWGA